MTEIQQTIEINSKEEMNNKTAAPSSKNELQIVENQLENKLIPEINTQSENIKIAPESEPVATLKKTSETAQQDMLVPITSEPAIEISQQPLQEISIPAPSTPERVVETSQQEQSGVAEIIPAVETQEPTPTQPQQLEIPAIKPEITTIQVPADTVPAQIVEVPAIPTSAISEQSAILEIISITVIQRPTLTASKTTATSAKKELVETILKRVRVPASKEFKNWDSRSFNLPGGKPSIVYHKEGTTVITATGYHEAPGFKSEDIDKLRNASEEDIRKLAKESFRCQLGFINAYFGNLREHPELPW